MITFTSYALPTQVTCSTQYNLPSFNITCDIHINNKFPFYAVLSTTQLLNSSILYPPYTYGKKHDLCSIFKTWDLVATDCLNNWQTYCCKQRIFLSLDGSPKSRWSQYCVAIDASTCAVLTLMIKNILHTFYTKQKTYRKDRSMRDLECKVA